MVKNTMFNTIALCDRWLTNAPSKLQQLLECSFSGSHSTASSMNVSKFTSRLIFCAHSLKMLDVLDPYKNCIYCNVAFSLYNNCGMCDVT